MDTFSEESLLLLRNWDTVQDILEALAELRQEFARFLLSLEQDLAQNDWWQEEWVFVKHRNTQVYISNRKWKAGDTYLIWIGLEKFKPENLFGADAPNLYVWVAGKRYGLAQHLAEAIAQRDDEVLGDVDRREGSSYVIQHPVTTFLPEECEDFADRVREQILGFFTHYARVLWELDALIQEHLGQKDADHEVVSSSEE